jgi:enoyl-CoA hydratase/carnithine racemase
MSGRAYGTIRVEEPAPGVLRVVLSRPENLNAIDLNMIEDMMSLSDTILDSYPEKYRSIVLCGDGRAFCSGGDLKYFLKILVEPPHVVESILARFHWFARVWSELPLPTIAAISGVAAGGGASMALLCDLRIGAPDARIGFPNIKRGLVPDLGCHYLLPMLVGRGRALELLYSGQFIMADEAMRIGLLNRIVPRSELESAAVELAAGLAEQSPDVLKTIKKLTRDSQAAFLGQILDREVMMQTKRFKSPEFRERISGFLKKT